MSEKQQQRRTQKNSQYTVPMANFFNVYKQVQTVQNLWKILFIIIGIFFIYFAYEVYQFRTLDVYKEKQYAPKGNFYHLIFWGLVSSIIYMITDHLWHQKFDSWVSENFISQVKYSDPVEKKKRSYTIAKGGYFTIFYSLTTVSGYMLIKDTCYFPKFLGGHGDVFKLRLSAELSQATYGMEIFYFIELGKQFGRLFLHMFIRTEGNYFQFGLHHAIAVYLIIYSYCANMWYIGIFILIIHDYTDLVLIIGRCYREYRAKNEFIINILKYNLIGSWIIVRIFVYFYVCIYATSWALFEFYMQIKGPQEENVALIMVFLIIMLICLQFMHLFWIYNLIIFALRELGNKKSQNNNKKIA